jgi:CDP-diacylglycerol---serine O-phosphatidyltransferase
MWRLTGVAEGAGRESTSAKPFSHRRHPFAPIRDALRRQVLGFARRAFGTDPASAWAMSMTVRSMIPRPEWLVRFEQSLGRRIPWHPNAISAFKLFAVAPALLLALQQLAILPGGPVLVTALFLAFGLLDYLDGVVARERDLETPFGRVFDRVTDYPLILGLSYFCLDVIPTSLLALKIAVDLLLLALFLLGMGGTQNRLRTAMSYTALLGLLALSQGWLPHVIDATTVSFVVGANVALSSTVALYNLGILRRRAVADILSMSNLACGVLSIVASSRGQFEAALALVLLGATFDGFDGAAARRWGASRWGVYADDVADGVSFGLAPAAAIAWSMGGTAGLVVGLAHATFVVGRLVFFTLRKGDSDPGMFDGVPSTVGGITALCAVVLFRDTPVLVGMLVGLTGAQMVAFDTGYRHLGRWLAAHRSWLLATPLAVVAVVALGALVGPRVPVAMLLACTLGYGMRPSVSRFLQTLSGDRHDADGGQGARPTGHFTG